MASLRNKLAAVPLVHEIYRGVRNTAQRCRIPEAWRSLTGRRHAILMFHRVRPAGQPEDPFDTCPSVSAETFRWIVEHLRNHFTVVPLVELCEQSAVESPLAAITFDDGWQDTYSVAFPILRQFDVPATVFVTTGKIGDCEPFWQQQLGRLFHLANACPDGDAAHHLRAVIGAPQRRLSRGLYRDTVLRWKHLHPTVLCSRLTVPGQASPSDSDAPRLFLNAAEIREMAAAGITFGSHTVTHAILPRLSTLEIDRELADSKAALENLLGHRIDTLAYPNGEYSASVSRSAAAAGYRLACTTRSRWFAQDDNTMSLPRVDPAYYCCSTENSANVAAHRESPQIDPAHCCCNGAGNECAVESAAAPLPRATRPSPCVSPDKIRILFLIDDFEGPEGGTEQHLLFLQRELPRDRFELHFGVLSGIRRMSADEFPVPPVMIGEGTRPGVLGATSRLRRLARLINDVDADVVHAFCRHSEHYALLATRWAGRGKVLGIRRNIGYWHNAYTRWRARLVSTLGAAYAANCEAAREFAARVEWTPRRRTTVIRNPVSARRLAEGLANVASRESLGIRAGEQVVGTVATVRPIKDYATFLRAARLVLDQHPRTRFLAIGMQEPDYAMGMQQLACELGINGQVSWIGPVPNPISALPLMDVAVLSSSSEAMSNAIVEYMAAGVATVATDVGGTREMVDDEQTGFLVPPGAPESMADRICRLLANDALRMTLGENARRKALAEFSEQTVLQEYLELYSRLAGR